MKLFTFLGLFLLSASCVWGQANAIDDYFQDYVEDERFSVVYVSPRLFQLFEDLGKNELDLNDQEADAFIDLAEDLRGLRILTTDVTPQRYFEQAKEKIDSRLYEPLVTIRERGGGKTEFLLRENDQGQVAELLFLSFGDEEFTLMSFVGPLSMDKVIRLADEMQKDENE